MEAFAAVYGKMQANGYDMANDLVEADYGCCTRNPPSMKSETNFQLGSGFQCEEDAFCAQADEEKSGILCKFAPFLCQDAEE